MFRYVRVYGVSNIESWVVYYANKPRLINANKIHVKDYELENKVANYRVGEAYNNAIVLITPASVSAVNKYYEAVIDVSENQPVMESVQEITKNNMVIRVFNEYGIEICNNSAQLSPSQSIDTTSSSAETASEPIDGSGEMTSEPIDETGTMI